ncbi:MAG: cupin, partial [Actinomycetota bacterium]|nr:cupin [Actinomycetota bacterium]
IGEREVEISRGDYVALLTGAEGAHQIVNSSDVALRYLCFSTMVVPDILVYPNSEKFGLFAGSAPGGPKEKRILQKYLRGDAKVGYYDGEE